ncbi:MAG: cupin domain-containing protein [Cyclobacteriaceae bacterium]|nr:cupin domain-containing protein [Cyclobacteriaceae bacterium]
MTPTLAELQKITPREIFPGFLGRFIHSNNMTFAYWEVKKDSLVPVHSHIHEQVVNMLEGKLELYVDDQRNELTPGTVLVIPSNAVHKGKALTDCKILDVFYPVREDYR